VLLRSETGCTSQLLWCFLPPRQAACCRRSNPRGDQRNSNGVRRCNVHLLVCCFCLCRIAVVVVQQQQQQQTGMTGFVRPPSGFVAVGGNIVAGKIAPPLSQQPRGELLVSVGFQPGAVNRLSIVVLKARNLPRHTDSGLQPRAMTGRGIEKPVNWIALRSIARPHVSSA
jgi:hypothetical protein